MRFLAPIFILCLYGGHFSAHAQDELKTDKALITGNILDFDQSPKVGEVIVFENVKSGKRVEVVSDDNAEFSAELPYAETYVIKIKGFNDDQEYTTMEVPALKEGQTRMRFTVNIQFSPPKSFTLKSVHFETGKATLTKESYPELEKLLEFMKLKKNARIEIAGHTDDVGDADSNMRLSQKRAEAVRKFLISNGIEANRIEAHGYGEDRPVADNQTEEGRQMNRRTEVIVLD